MRATDATLGWISKLLVLVLAGGVVVMFSAWRVNENFDMALLDHHRFLKNAHVELERAERVIELGSAELDTPYVVANYVFYATFDADSVRIEKVFTLRAGRPLPPSAFPIHLGAVSETIDEPPSGLSKATLKLRNSIDTVEVTVDSVKGLGPGIHRLAHVPIPALDEMEIVTVHLPCVFVKDSDETKAVLADPRHYGALESFEVHIRTLREPKFTLVPKFDRATGKFDIFRVGTSSSVAVITPEESGDYYWHCLTPFTGGNGELENKDPIVLVFEEATDDKAVL